MNTPCRNTLTAAYKENAAGSYESSIYVTPGLTWVLSEVRRCCAAAPARRPTNRAHESQRLTSAMYSHVHERMNLECRRELGMDPTEMMSDERVRFASTSQ
jgi:hypothetical protein